MLQSCASWEFNLNNPVKVFPDHATGGSAGEPFKEGEIELLIKARDFCEEAMTDHRPEFTLQRAKFERD